MSFIFVDKIGFESEFERINFTYLFSNSIGKRSKTSKKKNREKKKSSKCMSIGVSLSALDSSYVVLYVL